MPEVVTIGASIVVRTVTETTRRGGVAQLSGGGGGCAAQGVLRGCRHWEERSGRNGATKDTINLANNNVLCRSTSFSGYQVVGGM